MVDEKVKAITGIDALPPLVGMKMSDALLFIRHCGFVFRPIEMDGRPVNIAISASRKDRINGKVKEGFLIEYEIY